MGKSHSSQKPFRYFLLAIGAIVRKDLTAERRNRELFTAMLVFALLVILIFNFALALDARAGKYEGYPQNPCCYGTAGTGIQGQGEIKNQDHE